jgi:hypothetical protein
MIFEPPQGAAWGQKPSLRDCAKPLEGAGGTEHYRATQTPKWPLGSGAKSNHRFLRRFDLGDGAEGYSLISAPQVAFGRELEMTLVVEAKAW